MPPMARTPPACSHRYGSGLRPRTRRSAASLRTPATLVLMTEWIAIAATGIVGLVGVTAVLWTARQERTASLANLRISAEVERRRLDLIEKRRIYASYFAHAESTRHAVVAFKDSLIRLRSRTPNPSPAQPTWSEECSPPTTNSPSLRDLPYSRQRESCSRRSGTTTPRPELAGRSRQRISQCATTYSVQCAKT
jgi:hypothetical protein